MKKDKFDIYDLDDIDEEFHHQEDILHQLYKATRDSDTDTDWSGSECLSDILNR